jgi:hypothetical protein
VYPAAQESQENEFEHERQLASAQLTTHWDLREFRTKIVVELEAHKAQTLSLVHNMQLVMLQAIQFPKCSL